MLKLLTSDLRFAQTHEQVRPSVSARYLTKQIGSTSTAARTVDLQRPSLLSTERQQIKLEFYNYIEIEKHLANRISNSLDVRERLVSYLKNENPIQTGGEICSLKGAADVSRAVLTQCEGSNASKPREFRLRTMRLTIGSIGLCIRCSILHHDHNARGFCGSLARKRIYCYELVLRYSSWHA